MSINRCGKCGLAIAPDAGGVIRKYDGVCYHCWRVVAGAHACLPLPSNETFAPSNIANSKLFRQQYEDVFLMEKRHDQR